MATVGMGLHPAAFAFFDALRQYDVENAVGQMDDDATWGSPEGRFVGKEAIREHLSKWLSDPVARPSLTISDATANGPFVHYVVSVSGRMGRWPQNMRLDLLVVRGKVEQALWSPLAPASAAH